MEAEMSFEITRLLRERKLIRIKPDRKLVIKEINGAESDLDTAKGSLGDQNFKWATVQGYYSMFHSARALLYSKGFREKSHRAILTALRELFQNEIDLSLLDSFSDAMDLREAADYGLTYSETGAVDIIKSAEKLLAKAKEILKITK